MLILSTLLFMSCGHFKSNRKPNNENAYACHFKQNLDNDFFDFKFIPDEQLLIIKNNKKEYQLKLIESDFSSGGFIYKNDNIDRDWNIELDFKSFNHPSVKLDMKNLALMDKQITIEKKCE